MAKQGFRTNKSRSALIVLAGMLLLAAALFRQIWLPPVVGLADNGDFIRVMGGFGLRRTPEALEEGYYAYFDRVYRLTSQTAASPYVSSEKLFVQAAVWVHQLLGGQDEFDIRLLGSVHALGYWSAGALLLFSFRKKPPWAALALSAGLILILMDVGYVQYLNSFYSEPASAIALLFLTALTVLWVTEDLSPLAEIILFSASVLASLVLVTSKTQNAPLGLLLAGWSFYWIGWVSRRVKGRLLLASAACLALLAASLGMFRTPNLSSLEKAHRFNSVFSGILKVSPDPIQDLRTLHLPAEWRLARLAGHTWWEARVQQLVEHDKGFDRALAELGSEDIFLFYLRHPGYLARLFRETSPLVNETRLIERGNFEKVTGLPPFTQSERFNLWSRFKGRCLPHSPLFYLVFFAASLVSIVASRAFIFQHGRERIIPEFHLLLVLLANLMYLIALFGEGTADLVRHLFLFNLAWDLGALFLLYELARLAGEFLHRRRKSGPELAVG